VTYTYVNFTGVTSNFLSFSTVPGFTSMGNALDSLNHTNTQVQTLINALAVIPSGALPQTLSQLSHAKAFQQLATSTFQNAIFENTKLDSHLENIHNGLGGGDPESGADQRPGHRHAGGGTGQQADQQHVERGNHVN